MSDPVIPHLELKLAAKESIADPRIFLYTIHRIDIDADFRDAFRAVLQLDNEEAVWSFLTNQKRAAESAADPPLGLSVKEVLQKLDERTAEIVAKASDIDKFLSELEKQ